MFTSIKKFKLNFSFTLYILSWIHISLSNDLQCSFNFSNNYYFYSCYVENNLNITSTENIPIDLINDTHLDFKDNTQVIGFFAVNKNIRYMPKNIAKTFENLKIIEITYGRLKQIHQSDLQPFEQLEYCQLMDNDIEMLENGLFDYNINLKLVSFKNNRIIYIGASVFDKLGSLSWLNLEANSCINMKSENDTSMTKSVIAQVKINCIVPALLAKTEFSFFNESDYVDNTSHDISMPKIGLLNFYKYPHEQPWWIIIVVISIHIIFGGIVWHFIKKYRLNSARDDNEILIEILNVK